VVDLDPQVAKVAGVFDALSTVYDTTGVEFFQPIAQSLLRALAPRPGDRLLDIGCGRGAVLIPAADLVGATGTATGIDISQSMVAIADSLADRAGMTNVEVMVGNAQDPQLGSDRFDVIASSLVLFFLPDPAIAVAHWLPLLAPGGRIGVTTFGAEDPRWSSVDEVFVPYLPQQLRDARTTGAVGPFASDAGVEGLLTAAGFTSVHTVRDAVDVRFDDAEQWHAFSWSTGQRAMWLAVPEERRPHVKAEALERLAAFAEPDGSITFEQSIRHTLARRPD
jgi:ubiquinone/menaquinone biosynthesis C-methylase UbiE